LNPRSIRQNFEKPALVYFEIAGDPFSQKKTVGKKHELLVGYEEKQFWASSRSILKYFNMHSFTQNPPPALDPLMRDQLGGSTTPKQLAAEVRFAALLAHALSKFLRLKYSAASVSQFHTAWTSFSRNHLRAAKHWPAKTTRPEGKAHYRHPSVLVFATGFGHGSK